MGCCLAYLKKFLKTRVNLLENLRDFCSDFYGKKMSKKAEKISEFQCPSAAAVKF